MKNIWRWVLAVIAGLAIIGLLGFVRSNRKAYDEAHGNTETNFQDITWKWATYTDHTQDVVTQISDPNKYTILFKSDGTVQGKADCNNFGGSYSQSNGGFSISISTSTQAYCGEQSLDTQYLSLLSSVVAGGMVNSGTFALETAGGAQRLDFKR